jgi:thiamine phosphate synthase YjbQ (UPF0047 family)
MATFTEDFTRIREEFDQSFEDRQEFCEHIREDCAEQMEHNHQWQKNMGDHLRSELADFAGDLRAGGDTFRKGFPSR